MEQVTTHSELTIASFCFHQTTFGQNIRLENNASKAVRYTSFDHGTSIFLILYPIMLPIFFCFRNYIYG